MRDGGRRILIALGIVALAGCDRAVEQLEKRHQRAGAPPPIPPEVLAAVDTSHSWVGAPRVLPGEAREARRARPAAAARDRAAIGVLVLWNGFDPRCRAIMPMVEAWHEAYARYGVRVTGLHFAPYPFAGDTAAVGEAARSLGLRFPSAVVTASPPAGLTAGRGPIVIWPGGGDGAPEWLSSAADANAFEARLRRRLRQLHPEAGFPADAGAGVARGAETPPVRTLRLGTDWTAKGPIRGATPDRPQPFVSSFRFQEEGALDTPVPAGFWTPRRDAIESARGGPANFLAIRYDAGPVGVVMAAPAGAEAKVWVLEDERWIGKDAAGADVRFDSRGVPFVDVSAPRLYEVARGGRHVLKLSPDVPGIRFYAYTLEAAAPPP